MHIRSKKNASDEATTKEFITEIVEDLKFDKDDIVVMLYLTYPGRSIKEIENAIHFFTSNNAKSLICKKDTQSYPYLMMFEKENNLGEQVIKHDLCRRQDYKKVFEICHYIVIFKKLEVVNLNNNLYNENTIFYKIKKKIFDIDTEKDLQEFYEYKNKNNCRDWH